jgi:hypothetical protein
VTPNDIQNGSISEVSAEWIKKLKAHKSFEIVETLYLGRGAQEARRAAKSLDASHWIVSAGLGLIHSAEKVPLYDLTVTGNGSTDIRNKIVDEDYSLQSWWQELSSIHQPKRSLSSLIIDNDCLTILAMSSSYFDMVSDDLASLNDVQLENVRIIGPSKSKVRERFYPNLLPYDERLNGNLSPIRGTRSDFSQRACHHFVKYVWAESKLGSLDMHVELVKNAMDSLNFPVTPKRQKKNDEELIEIILELWDSSLGKSGYMLRMLRDDKLISCEQKRFGRLFKLAQTKREGDKGE